MIRTLICIFLTISDDISLPLNNEETNKKNGVTVNKVGKKKKNCVTIVKKMLYEASPTCIFNN